MGISLQDQIREILDDYTVELKRATNNAMDSVAKECVRKLKATSPQRPGGGKYAKGWAVKRTKGRGGIVSIVVHNKTDYQLTHLLERSHVIANKYGEYGRSKPQPHIAPVEAWAIEELPKEIARELE